MLLQICAQGLAHGHLHAAHHLGVAELGLGLALKLGLEHFHRDDGREALAEVLGGNLYLGVLEQIVVFGVFLESECEAAAEAGEVCAALDGVDVVDKGVDVLVVRVVVGEGHLDGYAAALGVEVDHIVDERVFARVDVLDKLAQTLLRVESLAAGHSLLVHLAHVGEGQGDAGVEKCQIAQAVGQGLVVVYGDGEYRRVGLEGDGGAGGVALALDAERRGGLAAGVLLHVAVAVAAHLGTQVGRQGVDTRYAHAVQTARHLVVALVKLAARVQHGEHHLQSALVLLLVHVYGDTAAVVDHGDGVVGVDDDVYIVGVAGKGLVDGVVDHLIHKVVQTLGRDVADVHGRTLAHGFQALEDLDFIRAVIFCSF